MIHVLAAKNMLFASLHKIYASQLFFHSENLSSKYDQQEKK